MISFHHATHLPTSSSPVPQTATVPQVVEDVIADTQATDNDSEQTGLQQNTSGNGFQSELTEAEKKQLRELKQRDREVRAHEQAHAAAAGSLAKGGPSYDYQRGPDGQLYAVGGSVSIDTSEVSGDPQATLEKAQQIQRAALAPAEPSSQDRAVAAEAAAMAVKARAELAQQDNTESSSTAVAETSEIHSHNCAECGGQHVSGSHAMSVKLAGTFAVDEAESRGFSAAA